MESTRYPYGVLRMVVNDTIALLQPEGDGAGNVDTLSFDLEKGTVNMSVQPIVRSGYTSVLGVLGLQKLYAGACLVVITAVSESAVVEGNPIFHVEAVRLVHAKTAKRSRENSTILALLNDAVKPGVNGNSFYFSYSYDLTLCAQRLNAIKNDAVSWSKPMCQVADQRFCFNRVLCQPLLEAGAQRFVLPVIYGFVEQITNIRLRSGAKPLVGRLVLIARRGASRAGTRHWRRGADKEGNVANFVESEQLVFLNEGMYVASYVQVRGSIPVLWTQIPNIKYKPPTKIAPREECTATFNKHMSNLVENYKDVVAVNLVNHHGSEALLEQAFRAESELFCSKSAGLRYVAFDFHKETKNKRYHRVSILMDELSTDLVRHDFFLVENGVVVKKQQGVVRTNCVDCLDRTNVLQCVLARRALESFMVHVRLMHAQDTLPVSFPELEAQYKILWADHGDAVSMQYAGTGAMKSGFTRTGKRTMGGALDDGVKAVTRYYLNNFQDGRKQDAIDLVTGAYPVDVHVKLRYSAGASPLLPVLVALTALVYASYELGVYLQGGKSTATALKTVAGPLLVSLILLLAVIQTGKFLVCRPQLRPQLANTLA